MSTSRYDGRHSKPGPLHDEDQEHLGRHSIPSSDSEDASFEDGEWLDDITEVRDDGSGDSAYRTFDGSASGSGGSRRRGRKHRARRIVVLVIVAVVVVLGIFAVAFVQSARAARTEASTMMSQASSLESQLSSGDMEAARRSVSAMSSAASGLHARTDGFLWKAACAIPVYGGDVRQVRALAAAADGLSGDVLEPLVDALPDNGLKGVISSDGTIDVQVLDSVLGVLSDDAPAIHSYATSLQDADELHVEQLKAPVTKASSMLSTLDVVASRSAELRPVIADMLGANGARTYLVMACNNSEIRSTGGMPGSFGLATVENGKIELGEFGSASTFPALPEDSPLQLSDEEVALFGIRTGVEPRDVNFNPDFPRVAELESELWEADGGQAVDGVISVDPVFLQGMLALTGGVTVNDITVDGSNASQVLLHDIYTLSGGDHDLEDQFFSEVAAAAAETVFGNIGNADPQGLMSAVADGISNGHLYVWMRNADEQSALGDLGWTGGVSKDPSHPVTGVYVAAGVANKVYWYLDQNVDVSSSRKNSDGSASYQVTVRLTNTISSQEASDEPAYIVDADSALRRMQGDMPLFVYLFAPAGGSITSVDDSDGYYASAASIPTSFETNITHAGMAEGSYDGIDVWYGLTQVAPGESTTITYTVTTAPGATDDLGVAQTPSPRA